MTAASLRRVFLAMAVSAGLLAAPMVTSPPPAHAATESLGARILDKAETRTGDWYVYGAAGPSYFDCSGLVAWAAGQLGVYLPHSTYAMLASPHLYRVWNPQRGDLAFYGTGHVEVVTVWHDTTFGALNTGTRVGWHTYYPPWWQPTMYFRVR
jgi:cell wall-associated NlpC family hydrolase